MYSQYIDPRQAQVYTISLLDPALTPSLPRPHARGLMISSWSGVHRCSLWSLIPSLRWLRIISISDFHLPIYFFQLHASLVGGVLTTDTAYPDMFALEWYEWDPE
jgi:hypothetical protein